MPVIEPHTVESEIRECALRLGVVPDIHRDDLIFQEGLWFNHQDTYVVQRHSTE